MFLSLDARKFEIEIDPKDKVNTLKMKMLDKAGVLPYQLTFYHCGRYMCLYSHIIFCVGIKKPNL